jgi:hypothetical protein
VPDITYPPQAQCYPFKALTFKKGKSMPEYRSVIGMFCYKDEAQYSQFSKLFTDSSRLLATFSAWKVKADRGVKQLSKNGNLVIRVYPGSTEEFTTWCRINGRGVDSKGRMSFASSKASEALKTSANN